QLRCQSARNPFDPPRIARLLPTPVDPVAGRHFKTLDAESLIGTCRSVYGRSVYWHPAPFLFYTSDSDARSQIMTQGTVQLVAGILAVVLVAIVILRRKGTKKKDEDDF